MGVLREGVGYLVQGKGMDLKGQGVSEEQKPVNHCESAELDHKPSVAAEQQRCEDVFGEFEGQLVFLEDPDAPTIDEWSDV